MATEIQSDREATAFDAIAENVYIIDAANYQMLYVNERARQRLGISDDSYKGEPCYKILRDREEPCKSCQITTCKTVRRWESFNQKMKLHYLVTESSLLYKGQPARLQLCMDISEQVKQRETLQLTLQAEAVLNETVHILYAETDINEAAPKMLEHIGLYMRGERSFIFDIHGKSMSNTYSWSRPKAAPVKDALQNIGTECVDRWIDTFSRQMTVGGSLIGFFGIANLPVGRMEGAAAMLMTLSYFLATSLVVTQSRQMMEKASYTDIMTGVANRNAFMRDIEKGQAELARSPKPIGVFYFDLNGLKQTNDTQGHRAGDRLITRLADMISLFFRKHEIYRTGGDEFVVLCIGMPEEKFNERTGQVKAYIERSPAISVSVGVAWSAAETGDSIEQVISKADKNMYDRKGAFYARKSGGEAPV